MTEPTMRIPFMTRLEAIRRRARRLLVMHGVLGLVCTALGLLLLLCILDYAFWFPRPLRLALTLGWLAVIGALLARQVAPALTSRFALLDVATKIEQRFPEFQDRLTSSVSFLAEPGGVTDPLRRQLIERTEQLAAGLPLEQAISTAPSWRMAGLAAWPVVLLAIAAFVSPVWLATACLRYAAPLGATEWPTRVSIEPLTGDLTIAAGESVLLAMRISRGADPALRGHLILRRDGGPTEKQPMAREGNDRFACTLPAVSGSFSYWFEAGDDSTRGEPARVNVAERPEVRDLAVVIWPPEYVQPALPRPLPAGQRSIQIIEGSSVELRFRASKPLGHSEAGPDAAVLTPGGQVVATATQAEDGAYSARFQPQRSEPVRIRLVDADGFESGAADSLSIDLTPDAPPRITLLQPTEPLEVTPQAAVRIGGAAEDDLGLASIEVQAQISGRPAPLRRAVTGWSARTDDQRMLSEFTWDWALADLELQIGDEIHFHLVASDNRVTALLAAQEGRSHDSLLRVVAPQSLAAAIAQELQTLAQRLRGHGQRQEQLMQRSAELGRDLQAGQAEDLDAALINLGSGQRSLAQLITTARHKAEVLAERLELNGISDSAENQQTAQVVSKLTDVVEPAMQEAAARLGSARGAQQDEQQSELTEAAALQRRAAGALDELLRELAVWDDYNSVMAHLRRLMDLQQQVTRETAAAQEAALGREIEDLPAELQQELERDAAAQDHISATIEEAQRKLQELEDSLRTSRPNEARSLTEARRRLAATQAAQRSRDAAQAIRRNQTGQAQIHQNQVERALADTIGELEQRRARQLAELGKRLADVEELLKSILQRQRALQEQTAAGAAESLPDLAPLQVALQRNTTEAASQIEALQEARPAAEPARLAVTHMAAALDALYGRSNQAATAAQAQAIDQLERSLQALHDLRQQAQQQLDLQNLLATRRALQELRAEQIAVREATGELHRAAAATGSLARKEVRRCRQLAKTQEGIIEKALPLHEKLASAPVYLWVLGRVRQAMTASHDGLQGAQVDDALLQIQDRAVELLDQLIAAIDQAQHMAQEQFAAGSGGGGGRPGGPSGPVRPVPTVSELLVLRAAQQDIQRRTAELAGAAIDGMPSEAQLQMARDLGQEQAELKELTIQLTDNARQAGGNR
jgi:hypothetical protein